MIAELAGIGVAEDRRRLRSLDRLHARSIGAVRAVDHHADAVHLADHLAAEIGEADVLVVTAAAREIVAIVGEQHLAHAETIIEIDHADIAVERVHAFEIEGDRELALAPGAEDVLHRLDLDQAFRVGADPVAKLRHAFQRLSPGHDVIAGVDREIIDAGGAPALQALEDRGLGIGEAAVIVPDQGRGMQGRGLLRDSPIRGHVLPHRQCPFRISSRRRSR